MSAMKHFSPFSNATWNLLGALSFGLEGKGATSISASKRGLTLKFGKLIVARGKNADELWLNYEVFILKVRTWEARREAARRKTA